MANTAPLDTNQTLIEEGKATKYFEDYLEQNRRFADEDNNIPYEENRDSMVEMLLAKVAELQDRVTALEP